MLTILIPAKNEERAITGTIQRIQKVLSEASITGFEVLVVNDGSKDATGALDEFIGLVVRHLKKGSKVRITGLGILQVKARPARMGRNPATGEAIKIKASKNPAFKAGKALKDAVN
mgnify:CR=1 FL=1